MDGQTDGRMGRPSYRNAWTRYGDRGQRFTGPPKLSLVPFLIFFISLFSLPHLLSFFSSSLSLRLKKVEVSTEISRFLFSISHFLCCMTICAQYNIKNITLDRELRCKRVRLTGRQLYTTSHRDP